MAKNSNRDRIARLLHVSDTEVNSEVEKVNDTCKNYGLVDSSDGRILPPLQLRHDLATTTVQSIKLQSALSEIETKIASQKDLVNSEKRSKSEKLHQNPHTRLKSIKIPISLLFVLALCAFGPALSAYKILLVLGMPPLFGFSIGYAFGVAFLIAIERMLLYWFKNAMLKKELKETSSVTFKVTAIFLGISSLIADAVVSTMGNVIYAAAQSDPLDLTSISFIVFSVVLNLVFLLLIYGHCSQEIRQIASLVKNDKNNRHEEAILGDLYLLEELDDDLVVVQKLCEAELAKLADQIKKGWKQIMSYDPHKDASKKLGLIERLFRGNSRQDTRRKNRHSQDEEV